eukprot:TRINITY_DN2668_c0_g3_i3.p3 TRINITY_DN2668_c0_g3~~TRINITY_DN2668_c0_g3_i3.p3  ORF type:complete len:156 (-),score=22.68 TRINITY_DN2668_c0_g3_i3:611-1078(-)
MLSRFVCVRTCVCARVFVLVCLCVVCAPVCMSACARGVCVCGVCGVCVQMQDIMMPELGGWDATKEIRACRDCHQPRIVALTANTFEEDRQKSFSVGMDAFLTKPTTLGNLEKQLRHEAAVLGLPYGGGVAPAANGHVQATPAPPAPASSSTPDI